MKKVKIHGAGSIGNHLAQASRRMGWDVDICDIDSQALFRTKNQIYPSRYGEWDENINLYKSSDAPIGGYDLIIIGTPPDSHMELAISAVREGAKAVLVEKPLCTPSLEGAQELYDEAKKSGCLVFVGYDHAISKSALKMSNFLDTKILGDIITLDVEFREFWGGIFKAHPWLAGPEDSYLGYFNRGGGACGEHSHAINLFQSFSHASKIGRINEVSASMDFIDSKGLNYDSISLLNFKTEKNILGRVIQDVVTQPTRKWARAQCEEGFIEWYCGNKPETDCIVYSKNSESAKVIEISKTRPDDFFEEMKHINEVLENDAMYSQSPISLDRGLETMLVIAASYKSVRKKCPVKINYNSGFSDKAFS
jgi:predicted dehydrogenase